MEGLGEEKRENATGKSVSRDSQELALVMCYFCGLILMDIGTGFLSKCTPPMHYCMPNTACSVTRHSKSLTPSLNSTSTLTYCRTPAHRCSFTALRPSAARPTHQLASSGKRVLERLDRKHLCPEKRESLVSLRNTCESCRAGVRDVGMTGVGGFRIEHSILGHSKWGVGALWAVRWERGCGRISAVKGLGASERQGYIS